jgi:hypothetical protein
VEVPLHNLPLQRAFSSRSSGLIEKLRINPSIQFSSSTIILTNGHKQKKSQRNNSTKAESIFSSTIQVSLSKFRNAFYVVTGVVIGATMIVGAQYLKSKEEREETEAELSQEIIAMAAMDPFILKESEVDRLIQKSTSTDELVQLKAIQHLEILCHNKVIGDRIIQKNVLNEILRSLKGSQNAYAVEAAARLISSLSAIGEYAPDLLNKENLKIVGELCHHPKAKPFMGEALRNLSRSEDSSVRENLIRLVGPLYCLYTSDEDPVVNKHAGIALHNILHYSDQSELLQKAINYAYIPNEDISELQDFSPISESTKGLRAAVFASAIYSGTRLYARYSTKNRFTQVLKYLPRSIASSAAIYLIISNTLDYSTEKAIFAKSRSEYAFPSALTAVSLVGAPYIFGMLGTFSLFPALVGLYVKLNGSDYYFPKHK